MESPRVLIADDQAHVLEALQLLLKNEGFTPETASSPAAVIEAVQDRSFDVLLLDMNYSRDTTSGDEGLELLSRIREVDSVLPVVLMTAMGSVDLAVSAMQSGGRDFVQKPWDNGKLLGSLRRHIEEGRLLRRKKEELKRAERLILDVHDAREIQQRLLPGKLPQLSGFKLHGSSHPANEVGGDYFDGIRLTETSVALCIGDVAGKGLPAALLMSNIQASVRGFSHETASPARICRQLNRAVLENMQSERLVTLFYAVLDSTERSLRYSNAGHLPPILLRNDGSTCRLSEGGTVLGVIPDAVYQEGQTTFMPGDRLVLVTDGITEAMNAQGEEFGEDRLIDVLRENHERSGLDLQQIVFDRVLSFTGQPLQDDATMMIISASRA